MTGMLVLFNAGSVSQLSTAIFLSLFGLVSYTMFQPFNLKSETAVACIAQFEIFTVVFCSLVGKLDQEKFEGSDGSFIGVMLVVLTILVVFSAIVVLCYQTVSGPDESRSLDTLDRMHSITTERAQPKGTVAMKAVTLFQMRDKGSHGSAGDDPEKQQGGGDESFYTINPMGVPPEHARSTDGHHAGLIELGNRSNATSKAKARVETEADDAERDAESRG